MTILKDYVAAVHSGSDEYKEAEGYYTGNVEEFFSSAALRQALRKTKHRGQHNYCRVVVDAVLNRLAIANVVASTETAQKKITAVWDDNDLALEANEVHRRALEYGDCYALVWPDETGEWRVSYNSPRTTALVYDPENPRKKLYAVKMWKVAVPTETTTKPQTRMNVYTADAIHKYVTDTDEVTEGTNWRGMGTEDNPFGEIPVFHFRTHRPYGKPEHFEAYGPQNDINKLLATQMFTVDYQGAPQRYALSQSGDNEVMDFEDNETDRENMSALQASPGSVWYMKGINGVGQFEPANPDVFWKPIGSLKASIAALTDTPFHYLDKETNAAGGEALRVSEAPLLKKVADRQVSFGATWRELFNFILKVEGIKARLEVKWDTVESFDSLDKWDVILKKINGGLSHAQALREGGYEEEDIKKILAERAEEAAAVQFYNRTDANGQQSLQNAPAARVSTADNAANNQNRNGLTEDAKVNGGRGTNN